ncbi:MAG: alcohol dehydrogenase, partial [Eubacterium sp.]
MKMNFNFNNPTNLIFGAGTIYELGKQKMPGKKALLLMSKGKSARICGAYDIVISQLAQAGAEVHVGRWR